MAKVAGLLPASSISDSELMSDSLVSDFSSLNFSAAEAVILSGLPRYISTRMVLKENLTGCTKNPCGSPPAEVFWLRQMIF